ncbi:MAG: hypothetical protein H8E57_01725 [Candidatus Cloacimonetes bacterium]|nr:hypothetical protein [Candidatus Cloacimonadota bacterium]
MNRNFPILHRDVALGQMDGKIIWQPRIGCWYDDKMFSGEGLPAPYTGKNIYEVYEMLDCSARLYEFNSYFKRIEHPSVRVVSRSLNEIDTEHTIHTAVGKQILVTRRSENSQHQITLKWEVETAEELKVATWREENANWEWDQRQYEQLLNKIGHLGAPTMFMPRMNVQCLYIEKMGVEKTVYALFENTDRIEQFFRALEENHERLIKVINQCPIEIINFGENIHSGTLSPSLFLRYHLPACQRRCELLHSAGKFVCSHWDGDTKPLLKYARETGLDGIEAITPKPQGDATLEEIKEALGDEIFLIDGIPAIYFDKIYSERTLIEFTHKIIEMFAPKLILGISDEISSSGDIERIRIVGQVVDEYNEKSGRNN